MIIGIDGNEANVKEQVGVSVYTSNLLYYFQKWSSESCQFVIYLRNKPEAHMPKEKGFYKYRVVPGRLFWSQVFLPLNLRFSKKIDVFFSPAHYSPRFCPSPLIVTIHDLSYFYYPNDFLAQDLYKLKNWTNYSVQKAKKIIAVSKNTKKDLIKFYEVPEEKIEVIYNGYRQSARTQGKKYSVSSPYILYSGTLQPRKNINLLIEAFELFHKENLEYKLVLAGKKGWLYDEIFQSIHTRALQDSIFFTGYVSDEELMYLYKHAFCFVMPSLYEGFGIPILEAMNAGCPVISSFTSSLPEIGGDACLYFDPTNKHDLLDKLMELRTNPDLRKAQIQKGKIRAKEFSFESSAKETLAIIKSQINTL